MRLRILRGDKQVSVQSQPCTVAALGREILSLTATMPNEPGDYTMIADLVDGAGKTIRSLRDFRAKK